MRSWTGWFPLRSRVRRCCSILKLPSSLRPVLLSVSTVSVLASAFTLGFAAQPAVQTNDERDPRSVTLHRPAPSDEEIAGFIHQFVADAVRQREIPGAAVVVVRGGRPILAKAYGVADYESGRRMSVEDTVLRQASLAKPFVWLLVLQLVEEGRLDLDADINSYLDFRIPDAFGAPITMRHLMTHSAGFADRYHGVMVSARDLHLREQLRANVPERVYAPGTTVAYSNYGAALAAYVVQRLRKASFEQLAAARTFGPLGMTRSTFEEPLPPEMTPLLASNYTASSRQASPFRKAPLAPMGGLSASPGDMGRFLSMLMNGGAAPGGRIVQPSTVKAMMRLEKPLANGLSSGMGLGLIVGEVNGVRHAGHGGVLTQGGATDLQILPDHGLGWYIGMNGRGANGSAIPLRGDLLLAVTERFFARRTTGLRAQGPSSAKDLAGTYLPSRRVHSGPMRAGHLGSAVTVTAVADGTIRIDAVTHPDGTPRRWLPAGRDRFVEARAGDSLVATRDDDGRVVRFASSLASGVMEFERAPFWVRLAPRLMPFLIAVLVLSLVAGPAIGVFRRLPFSRSGRDPRTLPKASLRVGQRWVGLVLLTSVAWLVFLTLSGGPGTFPGSRLLLPALSLCAILSCFGAAKLLADTVLVCLDPARSVAIKLALLLIASSAAGVAALFLAFGFADPSMNF